MNGDLLRPETFADYIGQKKVIRELDVRIRSARATSKPLADILLVGTPGSGKTALACIIGNELGEPTEVLNCPVNLKVLAKVVKSHSGILVLEECHRFSKAQLEAFLPLLEFRYLALPNGQRIEADWLTIVGTTTERGKIIGPLWDRFASKPAFTPYTEDELALIVTGMAVKQEVDIDDEGIALFAHACLGVPRVARNLVVAFDDMVQAARASGEPVPVPADALTLLQVERDGLTPEHVKYLLLLDALGGTKGLSPIAVALSLDEGITQELERTLRERGYVTLTESGRDLTKQGYERVRALKARREEAS